MRIKPAQTGERIKVPTAGGQSSLLACLRRQVDWFSGLLVGE